MGIYFCFGFGLVCFPLMFAIRIVHTCGIVYTSGIVFTCGIVFACVIAYTCGIFWLLFCFWYCLFLWYCFYWLVLFILVVLFLLMVLFVSPLIAASPPSYVHLSLEAVRCVFTSCLFSHLQSKFVFVLHLTNTTHLIFVPVLYSNVILYCVQAIIRLFFFNYVLLPFR